MKLVLKHNEDIKLYTEEMTYEPLIDFVETELALERPTINLCYTDDEGDQIVIASDEDLHVMETLVGNKSYIKVQVTGLPKNTLDELQNIMLPSQAPKKEQLNNWVQENATQPTESNHSEDPENHLKPKISKNFQQYLQNRQEVLNKDGKKKKAKPDTSYENFNRLMTQTINVLVEQKVKEILPKILGKESQYPKETQQKKNLEKGYKCLLCALDPIVGTRFECKKCPTLSLCEKCTEYFKHEHPLSKGEIPEKEEIGPDTIVRELYEMFFKDKKQKRQGKSDLSNASRYTRDLKLMFGGKIADYKQLVEENKECKLTQLVQKYCEEHKLCPEVGKKLYRELIHNRLSKKFKKQDPNQISNFLEQNPQMEYPELEKMISGKVQNQKDEKKKAKRGESKAKKEEEKEKHLNIAELIKKQLNGESKEEDAIDYIPTIKIDTSAKTKKEEKKMSPRDLLEGDKQEIYDIMVDFFGRQRAVDYPAFIEKHYKDDKANIPQRWAEQWSVINHV